MQEKHTNQINQETANRSEYVERDEKTRCCIGFVLEESDSYSITLFRRTVELVDVDVIVLSHWLIDRLDVDHVDKECVLVVRVMDGEVSDGEDDILVDSESGCSIGSLFKGRNKRKKVTAVSRNCRV